ncbi:hypothetical protein G4B88_000586 [Cannabis sativa]|uniref:F-box domain-containing protein n=1 Tax=Cannabis sativa TaxID=3483 RepID=A0A7J6DZH3_CANSA|nr:hypothetical protein G4B88_000586 [Cannabis sativa]
MKVHLWLMQMMASFSDLPSDILMEILFLVPPHSVLQLKFVNKFYYWVISDFINNPTFVSKHLSITKNQSSTSLIFKGPLVRVSDHLISYPSSTVIYDDDDVVVNYSVTPITRYISLPLIHDERCNDENQHNRLYHCDGLILQVNTLGKMMLCNPFLKEFKILPEPNNIILRGPHPKIGFEIDSTTNNYKCVSIWLYDQDCTVEVYTLGSDSWREIIMRENIKDIIRGTTLEDGLCWRGVCYWLVKFFNDKYKHILTFDMRDEKFGLILDFPLGALLTCHLPHLSMWNDLLVLCWKANANTLCITTLNGTKYVHLTKFENQVRVLPFSKKDDILIKVWRDSMTETKLVSYNLLRHMCREFVWDGNTFAFFECFYVKSLVSIRRF